MTKRFSRRRSLFSVHSLCHSLMMGEGGGSGVTKSANGIANRDGLNWFVFLLVLWPWQPEQ